MGKRGRRWEHSRSIERVRGVLLLSAFLLGACSGARQIETSPPQPAQTLQDPAPDIQHRIMLTVTMEVGTTPLPPEVQQLRFRVGDVALKPRGGAWITLPADLNQFALSTGTRVRKTVLTTRVLPIPIDSLAIRLEEVFLLYSANAGAPLTLPEDKALQLAVPPRMYNEQSLHLRLVFEPGASLSCDEACRWYFFPLITW